MAVKLQSGANIAVIGGGPAGSFFAHFILKMSARSDIGVGVTIYDRKSFLDYGPKGCNMCAGAIGHHLVEHLQREGIPLPAHVVRQEVEGYVLHAGGREVFLRQDERPIYTVFRGHSPDPTSEDIVSFDQFLLDHAVSMGAKFVRDKVTQVVWPRMPVEKAVLLMKDGGETEADLVVGAFGVNTKLRHGFMSGYKAPRTWVACQAEMPVDAEFNRKVFGNCIHVFALGERKIHFIAMTPKGNFVTISGIGPSVRMTDLESVLRRPEMKPYLPEGWRISCHCHPHFPVTAARKPYRDRGLLVGDACQARYLKNGIESAYFTALFAAKTCLNIGIGEAELAQYYRLCRERFGFDNRCGKVLFALHHSVAAHPRLARAHLSFAEEERMRKPREQQALANSLWSMFTGDMPYKKILKSLLSPALTLRLGIGNLQSAFRTDAAWDRYVERRLARLRARIDGKHLHVRAGVTVAIIGGGPGGASCAIRLLTRARAAGIPLRIVVFEGKDFDRHYNQCVGVLSPPLESVLREKLGVNLPQELIKRRIESYQLHSDNAEVVLDGSASAEPTYTVRRVMFDRLLLKKAEEAGAEIVRSRVTGVEFVNTRQLDEVRIYSESQYLRADVVVGAFGLDEAMLDCWEHATKPLSAYERPQSLLRTFVTKIHTDPAFIESRLGNTIHAFLLSGPRVEFGAVTPKGDHIIVNIAGRDVTSLDLDEFLERPQVRALLPEFEMDFANIYAGYFPTSPAENPYGHRYVLVGDATGWMRPFKGKGINTAVITGIRAADTVFDRGFSQGAFEAYARDCSDLRQDYWYGIAVRFLSRLGRSLGLFDMVLSLAQTDNRLQEIFYLAVSGEDSYKNILLRLLKPPTVRKLAFSSGRILLRRLRATRTPA
ncbi:MAG: NAD(P)/FAD-dependent oxidoreductase [Candidatus Abyssobacteria bacterium SURF_17]|uniref:NAD(P)/FAD-dependent oxidoreductase n=1 Tax=Candidatus Abyssobacteria bacterium SURF_17 TaxID=2093361 RepID=A0A419F976_9BACT|nr:MAG: NAD(P)/FAD-dependent oxidoreductase [Candidatus Abyssubacteria bacterium SURF_17]